jgi:hypothetical protein
MKLESLNSSMFENFKQIEFQNAMKINGGLTMETCIRGNCDTYNDKISNGWKNGAGTPIDLIFDGTKC